ncbi:hypothetical protein AOQ84DRAFT_381027 [Glonium stellatum]|uniref:Uncharacterized protein n=1 Tax=Glonium stellatum TaxID=574774 RepID=A0A8E2JNP8_9PEZI|nr:hypothetical protein AOQ84DRAFT_381027 [Glonium stellatum]
MRPPPLGPLTLGLLACLALAPVTASTNPQPASTVTIPEPAAASSTTSSSSTSTSINIIRIGVILPSSAAASTTSPPPNQPDAQSCWALPECSGTFAGLQACYGTVGGLVDPNDRSQSAAFQGCECDPDAVGEVRDL